MKPVRRIPREAATVALYVLAGGALVSVLIPFQLRGLGAVEAFALAAMPIVLVVAVGVGLWRSGRYALKSDDGPRLALPDPDESQVPMRAPHKRRASAPWVWLGLAAALCYVAAATSSIEHGSGAGAYLYSPEGEVAPFVYAPQGGLSWFFGRFWEFLAAAAVAGILALCAWLDEAVEP